MSVTKRKKIRVRAPGRICILGEHQDYLGLEVISGAMNLGVSMVAEQQKQGKTLDIHLTQTGLRRSLDILHPVPPAQRDYLQSGLNTMMENGFHFEIGWTIVVTGDLPIGKGVSSSSALSVAWVKLLGALAANRVDIPPMEVARLAHRVEVIRFGEPGGMQDHIASACGGLLHLDFQDNPSVTPVVTVLEPIPEGFLLVDSGQPKETLGMIARIRTLVENQFRDLTAGRISRLSELSLHEIPPPATTDPWKELRSTLINRRITRETRKIWPSDPSLFPEFLAGPISEHHNQLSKGIGSSSPAIDQCIDWSIRQGARAGKVIGSGGGGCLLLYTPDNSEALERKLVRNGFRCWKVGFGPGVSIS